MQKDEEKIVSVVQSVPLLTLIPPELPLSPRTFLLPPLVRRFDYRFPENPEHHLYKQWKVEVNLLEIAIIEFFGNIFQGHWRDVSGDRWSLASHIDHIRRWRINLYEYQLFSQPIKVERPKHFLKQIVSIRKLTFSRDLGEEREGLIIRSIYALHQAVQKFLIDGCPIYWCCKGRKILKHSTKNLIKRTTSPKKWITFVDNASHIIIE